MQYTNEELKKILDDHALWLKNSENGKRADLKNADLRGANLEGGVDLRRADLRWASLRRANLIRANLRGADLRWASLKLASLEEADLKGINFEGANLEGADFKNADLRGADLRGANLDYSCLPLWCGSLSIQFDDRQLIQIAYHLVKAGLQSKNVSSETKEELAKLIDFANQFHHVYECGKIEYLKEE